MSSVARTATTPPVTATVRRLAVIAALTASLTAAGLATAAAANTDEFNGEITAFGQ